MCDSLYLTPYSFPKLPAKYTTFQLCFIYTDQLKIKLPIIWYDLFLHMIHVGISGDITD